MIEKERYIDRERKRFRERKIRCREIGEDLCVSFMNERMCVRESVCKRDREGKENEIDERVRETI